MNSEYPRDDQRFAVCQSLWDQAKKKSKGNENQKDGEVDWDWEEFEKEKYWIV